jgi:tetraacyldisaccharide 4'-kinase
MRVLAWPISLAWSAAARMRAAAYRRRLLGPKHLSGVVISVGNITAGGTGKTPMVIWIAERLRAEGHRVGILTRGYRAKKISAPDDAGAAGTPQSDEVAIMSQRLGHHVSIGVGANRYESGLTLARHGVTWFVLDDGFQHMQLARDADIVMLDSTDPFGGNRLLPSGLLREPKSALRRADIVVISRTTHAPAIETIVKHCTEAPVFYATTELLGVTRVSDATFIDALSVPTNPDSAQKYFAFCGIGNPQAFFEDLSRWGFNLTGHAEFPDHHRYSRNDASRIESQARVSGASALICTEKDLFNLRDVTIDSLPVYSVRIQLKLNDPDGFWRAIQTTIARHQKAAAA